MSEKRGKENKQKAAVAPRRTQPRKPPSGPSSPLMEKKVTRRGLRALKQTSTKVPQEHVANSELLTPLEILAEVAVRALKEMLREQELSSPCSSLEKQI